MQTIDYVWLDSNKDFDGRLEYILQIVLRMSQNGIMMVAHVDKPVLWKIQKSYSNQFLFVKIL